MRPIDYGFIATVCLVLLSAFLHTIFQRHKERKQLRDYQDKLTKLKEDLGDLNDLAVITGIVHFISFYPYRGSLDRDQGNEDLEYYRCRLAALKQHALSEKRKLEELTNGN